jgi:hypothetical protein
VAPARTANTPEKALLKAAILAILTSASTSGKPRVTLPRAIASSTGSPARLSCER